MEVEVNTLEKQNKKDTNANKKAKDKLPFAVFICPKSNIGETEDYKQVFTDIISDRIKEKYVYKAVIKERRDCYGGYPEYFTAICTEC